MFRKMLVCTDLSPASDALIHCVEELKGIGMEEIVLIHVINVANTTFLEEMFVEVVQIALDRKKKILEQLGIRVIVEMPLGEPVHAIMETAEKHDVSVIMIGSHGKGILKEATLGSVSFKVLHQTRHPVLLARIALLEEGKCEIVCGRMFARVLFPTDFSETAERALDYLGKIVLDTGCPVTIMHVLEHKNSSQQAARQAAEDAHFLLEAKKKRLETCGASNVTIFLVHGKPVEKIIERTKTGDYSIIVMGGQGKGIIKEFFLGSVADEVVRHAGTPVLLIPVKGLL